MRGKLKSVAHRSTLPINTLSKHISRAAHVVVKWPALALRECGLALRFGPVHPAAQRIRGVRPQIEVVIRSWHENTKIVAKESVPWYSHFVSVYCTIYAGLSHDFDSHCWCVFVRAFSSFNVALSFVVASSFASLRSPSLDLFLNASKNRGDPPRTSHDNDPVSCCSVLCSLLHIAFLFLFSVSGPRNILPRHYFCSARQTWNLEIPSPIPRTR